VAFDFDKDGWMDLAFTHAGAPGISLWRNVEGKRLERVPLPEFGWQNGWGIAALDYDTTAGSIWSPRERRANGAELRLLRNLGEQGLGRRYEGTAPRAVKLNQPRAIAVADIDGKWRRGFGRDATWRLAACFAQ